METPSFDRVRRSDDASAGFRLQKSSVNPQIAPTPPFFFFLLVVSDPSPFNQPTQSGCLDFVLCILIRYTSVSSFSLKGCLFV